MLKPTSRLNSFAAKPFCMLIFVECLSRVTQIHLVGKYFNAQPISTPIKRYWTVSSNSTFQYYRRLMEIW